MGVTFLPAPRRFLACMPALFLSLAAGASAQLEAPETTVYSAYVVLAEGGTPLGRLIVEKGTRCPDLVAPSGNKVPTHQRRNPHGFPVKVCEAILPYGLAFTIAGGKQLPAVKGSSARVQRSVSRVAVFGDSGCQPKYQDGCTMEDPAWPFPRLAAAAAKNPPDLVIHVGDYNYRGTPSGFTKTVDGKEVKLYYYDAGDGAPVSENCGLDATYYSQNSAGNPDADNWNAWWLDFFQPAAPLLAAAPWVFARGNHELCSHGGPGFFYFLDASSDLLPGGQLSCPPQDGGGPVKSHLLLTEPRVVNLGGVTLLVLDSANACDQLPGLYQDYRRQLQIVGRKHQLKDAWLVTHRPVWGIEDQAEPVYGCDGQPSKAAPLAYGQLNQTLQCALAGETGDHLLPRLEWILAGHMHRFETVNFAAPSPRPPTLIVGNSGVGEDTGPPVGAFAQALDGATATGFSLPQYGYLELAKSEGGSWRGQIVALDPAAWSPYVAPCGAGEAQLCVKGLP
jgi:hypothetical protein